MHKKHAWAKRVRKERFRKKYLSKAQATRLLQVDSMNFRRLCILKGIYPRAIGRSKQKASGNDKQYYLAKEIKWLVHDQLVNRIFAYRAHEKKVKRAKAMKAKETLDALKKPTAIPQYKLDATLKERYPSFREALLDVDDAMTNICLYAFLSPEIFSDTTVEFHHALPSGLHQRAKDISAQFLNYVSRSHSLNKGFVSIKGYYYEANIRGVKIIWLMPHEFSNKFPSGVQQYILITFLEMYVELMKFVLYKLELELKNELEAKELKEETGELLPNAGAEDFTPDAGESIEKGHNKPVAAAADGVPEKELITNLFKGFTFYLSREVPHKHCRFVIESCGGNVVSEFSTDVTHYVVDRPSLLPPHIPQPNVEYIQPQYLFDCLNARFVLPANGYRMGEDLPPHISPFTVSYGNRPEDRKAVEEVRKNHPRVVPYVPQRIHEIRKMIDPTYVPLDPEKKHGQMLEEEGDEDSDLEHALERGSDDDVELSDDEAIEAKKKPEWKEEVVTEHPERGKLSAFKVKKQRELNLLNVPTDEAKALRRIQKANKREEKKQKETPEQRLKRKIKMSEKEDRATKRMQLQVARKKAARYYKMVSGVTKGVERREQALQQKAEKISKGQMSATVDGTAVEPRRKKVRRDEEEGQGTTEQQQAKAKKKRTESPYSKLPKWVR